MNKTVTTKLVPVRSRYDVCEQYRETPVADLLAFHNLGASYRRYTRAQLLIGMCMDHRLRLRAPPNFAYVLRTGGANFRGLEFQISFAIAVGGVRAVCLIGHDECGMAGLALQRESFVEGLMENAGWRREAAEKHFNALADRFEIAYAAEFALSEAERLRRQYPAVLIAPLLYSVSDGTLSQIENACA
jgi:carbonic anhydrase